MQNFANCSEVFLEKHWRSVVSRSVCEYFLDAQRAAPYVSEPRLQLSRVSFNKFLFSPPAAGCAARDCHAPLLSDHSAAR